MAYPGCPQDTNIFDLLSSAGVDPSTISIEIKEASPLGELSSASSDSCCRRSS